MRILPHILIGGNCKDAIDLYIHAFGARVERIITFGDVGFGPESEKDLIMNAQIDIQGHKFQLADHKPETISGGNQIYFTIFVNTENEVREIYNRVGKGGKVVMEPKKTYFSDCHCAVIDKFGIMWEITIKNK